MFGTSRMLDPKVLLAAGGLALAPLSIAGAQAATPAPQQATQTQTTKKPVHHSVIKGAIVGGVAGHVTHKKHGMVVGAIAGAEVQHHRNKMEKKNAAKKTTP